MHNYVLNSDTVQHAKLKCNMLRSVFAIAMLHILGSCQTFAANPTKAQPPKVVVDSLTHRATVIPQKSVAQLPDGSLLMLMRKNESVFSTHSTDGGISWSKPHVEFAAPNERSGVSLLMTDHDGELHAFMLAARGDGRRPTVDRFYDIYHCCTINRRTEWTSPEPIYEGYVGSLNGAIQLKSGRMVVAHQYWVPGRTSTPPTGSHVVTSSYSDNGGKNWLLSPAKLTAPCDKNYPGSNYGACEPCLVELKDGRIWMLMRTQTGLLYESYSGDGVQWSSAQPTSFRSSNSPASVLQLTDGRLVIFWNQCEDPSRVNGAPIYTNRDVLHAAVSADGGKTWSGYREVYRDPLRNQSPPKQGDRGTAYPYSVEVAANRILLGTGQSAKRVAMIQVDPNWITATHAEEDFSQGADNWSTYKPFGPAHRYWRDRAAGAQVIDHPDQPGKNVLHVRRPDEKSGDDAVWNFPAGERGCLKIRLLISSQCMGAQIAFADRHITPNDPKVEDLATFVFPLCSATDDETIPMIERDHWTTLQCDWDILQRKCTVSIEGKTIAELKMVNTKSRFVNYLRLKSTAPDVDNAGILIDNIQVDIDQ